jgi:hypothetical protein
MEQQTGPLGQKAVKFFVRIITVSFLGLIAFKLYPHGIFSMLFESLTAEHIIKLIFSASACVMAVIFLFKKF